MNLYKFYIKRKYVSEYIGNRRLTEDNKNDYLLYAFTDSKKLAKRFWRERSRKRFVCKTDKDIEKTDFVAFANRYPTQKLAVYEFVSFNGDEDKKEMYSRDHKRAPDYVKVLCTVNERQILDSITDDQGGIPNPEDLVLINPAVFKDKYYKVLDNLEYVRMYKFAIAQTLPVNIFHTMVQILSLKEENLDIEADELYEPPNVYFDEIETFFEIFHNTF